jgi:hypothetical protein
MQTCLDYEDINKQDEYIQALTYEEKFFKKNRMGLYSISDFYLIVNIIVTQVWLIFITFIFSFWVAMLFLMLLVFYEEYFDGVVYSADNTEEFVSSRFLVKYNIYNDDIYQALITMFYFAQTTWTTIGFGDFIPRCSFERIIIAFIMLIAVLLQSLVMTSIIKKLLIFRNNLLEFELSKELSLFMKVIEKFNDSRPYQQKA